MRPEIRGGHSEIICCEVFFFVVVEIKPRALHMIAKCFTTELQSLPTVNIFLSAFQTSVSLLYGCHKFYGFSENLLSENSLF